MNHDADITDHLTVSEMEIIEQVCTRFEQQWRSDNPPAIEELLTDHDGHLRKPLVAELIKLDIDYHQRAGQTPARHDYLSRFPDDAEAIEMAFSNEPFSIGVSLAVSRISDPAADHPPIELLKLESEYRIERFHARGGLGEIYIASDKQLGRKVAIKFPRNRESNSTDRLRLEREAEITGRLKHPGIVPVHAASHSNDALPCYIMQFIEGQTFRDAITDFHAKAHEGNASKYHSWDFRRLIQRLISVCNTVAYAHEQGVIHRDIKPANVMLGQFGETFLLDWGLAKVVGANPKTSASEEKRLVSWEQETWRQISEATPEQTREGQPIGTPQFASPEQVMGRIEDHDARSDVYSLGATMYFLLLGRRAIEFEDFTNLATASAIKRITPPRKIDSEVPADLEAICLKAITFEAADRYQSVTSLTDDLERYLADEPISIGKPNWPTRARRWVRKNPRFAASVATGTTVALIGISIGAWMLTQKADELAKSLSAQRQSNIKLQEAKESADKSADDALTALRALSNRVVQQWFAKQESFSDTEREFMEEILTMYQDFARSKSDDSDARSIQAEAFQRIGQIQMLLGQNSEALASVTNVVELLSPLPNDATETVRVINATSVFDQGKLLFGQGDSETGLVAMKEALELFQSLADDFPDEPRYLDLLSNAQNKLGSAYTYVHEPALAIAQFSAAKTTTAILVGRFPGDLDYLTAHAIMLQNMGVAVHRMGDYDKSVLEHQLALEVYETLRSHDAVLNDVYRANGFSDNYIGLALSLFKSNRVEDAIEANENAAAVATHLVETWPAYPDGYVSLARAHLGLTLIYKSRKDYDSAIFEAQLGADAADKAVSMSPDSPKYLRVRAGLQKEYANALRLNGNMEDAETAYIIGIEYAQQRFELVPNIDNRVSYARVLCQLGKIQSSLDRKAEAIGQFEKAIELLESGKEADRSNPRLDRLLLSARKALSGLLDQ